MLSSLKAAAIIAFLALACYTLYVRGQLLAAEEAIRNLTGQLYSANDKIKTQNLAISQLKSDSKILTEALEANLESSKKRYSYLGEKHLTCEKKLDQLITAFESRHNVR